MSFILANQNMLSGCLKKRTSLTLVLSIHLLPMTAEISNKHDADCAFLLKYYKIYCPTDGRHFCLAICTWPDILFHASLLARQLHAPTERHFIVAKPTVRYLSGTANKRTFIHTAVDASHHELLVVTLTRQDAGRQHAQALEISESKQHSSIPGIHENSLSVLVLQRSSLQHWFLVRNRLFESQSLFWNSQKIIPILQNQTCFLLKYSLTVLQQSIWVSIYKPFSGQAHWN